MNHFAPEDWRDNLTRCAEQARVDLFCAETPEQASAAARKVRLYDARVRDTVSRGVEFPEAAE